MEKQEQQKGSFNMPMVELILVIGIFTIVSVLLLRMYFSANHLQKEAADFSRAVILAESIAEEIKAAESIKEAAKGHPSFQMQEDGTYLISYDKDFKETTEKKANYEICIIETKIQTKTGSLNRVQILAYQISKGKEEPLVELFVSNFAGEDEADNEKE